jgi:hypothetical protein
MRPVLVLLLALSVAACGKGGDKTSDKATDKADPAADKANADIAGLAIQKLAYEAFPVWAASHPDKDCPGSLADLQASTSGVDANDPWGHPYELFCGDKLPKGAHGVGVRSLGRDGKPDTADDIKSWQ